MKGTGWVSLPASHLSSLSFMVVHAHAGNCSHLPIWPSAACIRVSACVRGNAGARSLPPKHPERGAVQQGGAVLGFWFIQLLRQPCCRIPPLYDHGRSISSISAFSTHHHIEHLHYMLRLLVLMVCPHLQVVDRKAVKKVGMQQRAA